MRNLILALILLGNYMIANAANLEFEKPELQTKHEKKEKLDRFFDYNANFGFLSRPIGAILEFNLGYNKLLWGDSADGPVDYGYIHPAIKVRENGFVHAYDATFEIRPLPILGFTVGHLEDYRNVTVYPFNCTDLACRGRLHSNYIIGSAIVGFENFFMLNEVQLDHMAPDDKTKAFVDEQSNLKGSQGEDFLLSSTHLLGYRINDNWLTGGFMQIQTMRLDGNAADRFAAIGGYTKGQLNIIAGLGTYHSNVFARDFSGFFRIAITPVYGLALH